jgi:hypothetical protein
MLEKNDMTIEFHTTKTNPDQQEFKKKQYVNIRLYTCS